LIFQLYQWTPAVDILPVELESTINENAYENTFGQGCFIGSADRPVQMKLDMRKSKSSAIDFLFLLLVII